MIPLRNPAKPEAPLWLARALMAAAPVEIRRAMEAMALVKSGVERLTEMKKMIGEILEKEASQ